MMTAARIMLGVSILTMFVGASEFVPTPTTRSSGEIDTRWVFSKGNSYGAPLPPWAEGAAPGWSHCPQSSGNCSPDVPCLEYGTALCNILSYFPDTLHCPRPSDYARYMHKKRGTHNRRLSTRSSFEHGRQVAKRTEPSPVPNPNPYEPTFSNATGAIQANDYMTFGLVDTVEACQAMCDAVTGCQFVNTYHDVHGKDGSPLLTCSLFAGCHDISSATNTGGQTQPDGSLNSIAQSDGWCKSN
ncbi:hypothetical protein BJ165DRAFT_1594169 [Panaeolus papilionaceus]|nr:hypothetical protein BJ165DRAFT_1594169 [Panaeolus papilionaceus]